VFWRALREEIGRAEVEARVMRVAMRMENEGRIFDVCGASASQ
jgi:hypothetical protein